MPNELLACVPLPISVRGGHHPHSRSGRTDERGQLERGASIDGGQQVSENRNSLARLGPSYLEDEYRSTLLFQQLFLSVA